MASTEKQSQSRVTSLRWKSPRSLIRFGGHLDDDGQAELAPWLRHVDRDAPVLEEGRELRARHDVSG
eukprot:464760-Prymnesium_polylepis.1